MRIRTLTIIAAAATAAAAVFSCKKQNTSETTLNYLSGGMGITVERYVDGLDSIRVTAFGVTHPDGNDMFYYYYVSDLEGSGDTVKVSSKTPKTSFHKRFKLPYETGTYKVTCGAMADGFYSTSATKTVTLVKPGLGESLTGTGINSEDPHITADGKDYYYIHIGELDWMRNNLAVSGSGLAMEGCEVVSYPLGRYYTYTEASSVCPDGWRLPTADEWKGLTDKAGELMVEARFNGNLMWPVSEVDRNNSTEISAIPSGYASIVGNTARYKGVGEYAAFWTADSSEEGATYIYLMGNSEVIYSALGDKTSFSASVRCVR
ncbi:MAG: hypothetical protein IKR69_03865 [Bacteroidales bacterium]|nr:hypothetical protein [Bacteroidales bacterium]